MSDRMKKIFSFGLPFVSCVVAVFFLLPSCGDNEEIVQRKLEKSYSVDEGKNQLVVEIPCAKHGLFPVLPSGVYPRRQRGGEKPLLR